MPEACLQWVFVLSEGSHWLPWTFFGFKWEIWRRKLFAFRPRSAVRCPFMVGHFKTLGWLHNLGAGTWSTFLDNLSKDKLAERQSFRNGHMPSKKGISWGVVHELFETCRTCSPNALLWCTASRRLVDHGSDQLILHMVSSHRKWLFMWRNWIDQSATSIPITKVMSSLPTGNGKSF